MARGRMLARIAALEAALASLVETDEHGYTILGTDAGRDTHDRLAAAEALLAWQWDSRAASISDEIKQEVE